MASEFQPPPTYAEVALIDETTGKARFNPIWLKWFVDVAAFFSSVGGDGVNHELLSGLLGGSAAGHYHMTVAENNAFTSGVTGTVTLFGPTTNGSLTFVNGIITAAVTPT